jgi:hypothetical protein
MTKERTADVQAILVELEYEIWLAAKQGRLNDGLSWKAVIDVGEGKDPFFVVLTGGAIGRLVTPAPE